MRTLRGGIRSLLRHSLAQSFEPVKREPAPDRIARGPKARVQGNHPKQVHSDEVVLEVRRLHEVEGLSAAKIIAMFAAVHGIDLGSSVRGWLDYQTRSHLVPTRGRHEPYLTAPKSTDQS